MSLSVLIVDDEENARQFLGELLATKSYNVIGVGTLGEAREHLMKGDADIVLAGHSTSGWLRSEPAL